MNGSSQPDGWLKLDQVLGAAEVVLIGLSIVLLLLALRKGSRRRAIVAVGLWAALALTVAQPFGVTLTPITGTAFSAGAPSREDAEEVHYLRVLGVPIVAFRPYTREVFEINGGGGDPTWFKVRSWVWPGLLTNGAKGRDEMCTSTLDPCWQPDALKPLEPEPSKLQLVRDGNEWRYRILTSDGRSTGARYRLGLGIVSLAGLVYWLLGGALALLTIVSKLTQPLTGHRQPIAQPT